MVGIQHIKIYSRRIKYEFDLKRNITIIRGNSGTGKTTLINLIQDAIDKKGVNLECKVPCKVLRNNDWELILKNTHESIVFMDEDFKYLFTERFSEVVRESSNYYVIISRDEIPTLTYSIKEMYEIHTSNKYNTLIPSYSGIENRLEGEGVGS